MINVMAVQMQTKLLLPLLNHQTPVASSESPDSESNAVGTHVIFLARDGVRGCKSGSEG